jgi:hypothetical protein
MEVVRNEWGSDNDVLEVHGLRGGSRVQQRIQPRQTNDESSLLELVVVQDEGGDDKTLESTGTEGEEVGYHKSTTDEAESQTHQLINK